MMTSLFLNGVPLRGSILIISGGNKFICLRCYKLEYRIGRMLALEINKDGSISKEQMLPLRSTGRNIA
jgi:hypothetical protein